MNRLSIAIMIAGLALVNSSSGQVVESDGFRKGARFPNSDAFRSSRRDVRLDRESVREDAGQKPESKTRASSRYEKQRGKNAYFKARPSNEGRETAKVANGSFVETSAESPPESSGRSSFLMLMSLVFAPPGIYLLFRLFMGPVSNAKEQRVFNSVEQRKTSVEQEPFVVNPDIGILNVTDDLQRACFAVSNSPANNDGAPRSGDSQIVKMNAAVLEQSKDLRASINAQPSANLTPALPESETETTQTVSAALIETQRETWHFESNDQIPPLAKDSSEDDLTLIRGIGPRTSERLNEHGIYSFRQIAMLTGIQLINLLGSDFEITGGLRNVESWPRQARKILEMTETEMERGLIDEVRQVNNAVRAAMLAKQQMGS